MRGGLLDMLLDGDLQGFLIVAIVLIVALSIHEYGHALAATLQGDPTAKLAGRLTLNPLSHIDPFGALAMVLVGFGWGKPVPFSPNRLSSKRFGVAIVALAGPVTNVILAVISAAALSFAFDPGRGPGGADNFLVRFLFTSLHLNVVLTIFNLIPIPPLDGSRILSAALPPSKQHIVFWLDRWGFILLLVFVFVLFGPLLGPVITFFVDLLLNLFGVI